MIRRIQAATAERDKGFTLIELLVVIVIIGILAAIAIPAFLGQRQQGWDASVKSDLKAFAIAAETRLAATQKYPDPADLSGFATNGAATPIKSPGTTYVAYVDRDGSDAGYVIYGVHADSGTVFRLSSYDGGAPTPVTTPAGVNGVPTQSGAGVTPAAAPTGGDFGSPSTATFTASAIW